MGDLDVARVLHIRVEFVLDGNGSYALWLDKFVMILRLLREHIFKDCEPSKENYYSKGFTR